jgi:hypothetical protein
MRLKRGPLIRSESQSEKGSGLPRRDGRSSSFIDIPHSREADRIGIWSEWQVGSRQALRSFFFHTREQARGLARGLVFVRCSESLALLHYVKRVTPPLEGCVAGDLGCKGTVGRKCWSKRQKCSSKARGDGVDRWAGVREAEVHGRSKTCCFPFQDLKRDMQPRRCTGRCATTRHVWRGATRRRCRRRTPR